MKHIASIFRVDPEDGGHVSPKRSLTFNRLHGIISQKKVLFITTAVRTSNPTTLKAYLLLTFSENI
jgi:hypothetical protein